MGDQEAECSLSKLKGDLLNSQEHLKPREFSYFVYGILLVMEQFLIECHGTKTKAITYFDQILIYHNRQVYTAQHNN